MGSIDYDSELAYHYIGMTRRMKAGGAPVRSRPPINRDEALRAREVRIRVERSAFGYAGTAHRVVSLSADSALGARSEAPRCERCGQAIEPGTGVLTGSIYTNGGRIDKYVCAGGCEGENG